MAQQGKGWHGDSKGHANAAKGDKVKDTSTNKGQGWHGDTKGHSKAAKGEQVKSSDSDLLDPFNK